jgi:hypothetical protein
MSAVEFEIFKERREAARSSDVNGGGTSTPSKTTATRSESMPDEMTLAATNFETAMMRCAAR